MIYTNVSTHNHDNNELNIGELDTQMDMQLRKIANLLIVSYLFLILIVLAFI